MTLAVPASSDPGLSVVMVSYGAWELTERAISALIANTDLPLELIVVDNLSDERTRAQLAELRNVQLILNDENRGFGPANNQGAKQARGEYLLLLNTDAFVHPGWHQPLFDALADPAVGAVVPRLLNVDGSLQEAGALVAADGSVMLYGEGDDPDLPSYRFRRRIDYGSAACMLLRRTDFTQRGGFDERYAPAYFEDVDLCMRLAQDGLRVVYEPRSTVTHVRFGAGGAETASHLSQRNHALFARRWGPELGGRPWTLVNASDQAVIAARDAVATPRLLICSGADQHRLEPLIGTILENWRSARLTWANWPEQGRELDQDAWLARGAEVLDGQDASWLDGRLFHYDAVITDPRCSRGVMATVDRTQPHAARFALDELADPGSLHSRMLFATAGIAPPA
jgi:GT2 family glycosyltransferase